MIVEIKSIEGLERRHLKDGLLVSIVYNSEEELDENSNWVSFRTTDSLGFNNVIITIFMMFRPTNQPSFTFSIITRKWTIIANTIKSWNSRNSLIRTVSSFMRVSKSWTRCLVKWLSVMSWVYKKWGSEISS